MPANPVLWAMERASILVEDHPGRLGKTRLAVMVGGRKQAALQAVDRLCSEGFVGTTRGHRGKVVYTSLRPYRHDPGLPGQVPEPVVGELLGAGNLKDGAAEPVPSGNDREPHGTGASGPTAAADPDNDREAPLRTANGRDRSGDPAPVIEARCRCCRRADIRDRINRMLASGFSLRAIFESLAEVNAGLAPNRRITRDSLETHRRKHFPVQAGANAIWRKILEGRAAAEAATYQDGVINLVTPRAFFEVLMTKAFAGLVDETAEIGPELGLRAAGELSKLTAKDDDEAKWAKVHSQQQRIIEVMKSLAPALQDEVLAKLDGRPWPPPSGGARLAVIQGGVATDEEFDPLDDEDDEGFEDDD